MPSFEEDTIWWESQRILQLMHPPFREISRDAGANATRLIITSAAIAALRVSSRAAEFGGDVGRVESSNDLG